jgi:DNA-binding transcriptional LysR family regulator
MESAKPHRFQLLHVDLVHEWRTEGASVVICPNSPAYMARFGIDAVQWTLDLAAQFQKVTDRPIVIRWKSSVSRRPLYVDLHTAWMVVVFSSNAAIEALAAGVPVCVLAPWASSAPMGISDINLVETPYYPDDRIPFLWALAERQWSLAEMATGMAWRKLHGDQ